MIERKSKPCKFCIDRDAQIDYKDVKTLQRFVNSYGKIDAKKRSGLC
ncbi:30S ribosomal protein S18, partial [Patescibacteria group bacterium]|nr:30S ribosomal protein S18 [Patescibacteria group bacterium]